MNLRDLSPFAAAGPHGELAARGHHERGDDVRPVRRQEGEVGARLYGQLGTCAAVVIVRVALVIELGARLRPVGVLEVGRHGAGGPDTGDRHQGEDQQQWAQRGHGDIVGRVPCGLLCP